MALASVFSMMGLDDAAEGAQKVGVVFMGLGAVLSLIPPIIKVVETSLVTAGVAS
jgi:hypothetical protein